MKTRAGRARRIAAVPVALALLLAAVSWLTSDPGARLGDARDRVLAVAAETFAPALSRWLAASAETATRGGVSPVPPEIRTALEGFVDDATLERLRYRIGGGGVTSIQALAFLHPHIRAVTLDGVIVFRDAENAAKPRYWVHEIAHLEQIRRSGLEGFARRYIADAGAVEAEAWALTDRYLAWALRRQLNAVADAPSAGGGG